MGLKAQLPQIEGEDESFERCWSAEEMGEILALISEDKAETFDKLPQSAQDK